MPIALRDLKGALPEGGLFGGGGWQWSPEPLRLTASEAREMMTMGHPLAKFQQASDLLYRRSAAGKVVPWLAEVLQRKLEQTPAGVGWQVMEDLREIG